MLQEQEGKGPSKGMRMLLSLIGAILATALLIILVVTGFESVPQNVTIVKTVITFCLICINLPLSDRPLGYALSIIWSLAFVLNLLSLAL